MLEMLLCTGSSIEVGEPVANPESVLLFHFDGVNGGTNFIDAHGHVAVPSGGGIALSDMTAKFGGTALYCGGGYFDVADAPELTLSTTYTIEGWIYVIGGSQNAALLGKGSPALIQVYANSLYVMDDSGTYRGSAPYDGENKWNHFAITRDLSNVCRIFINGRKKSEVANSGTFGNNAGNWRFGSSNYYGVPYSGLLDEVCVSPECRYINDFTPPAAPFF